jgi:hypothetical protein
VSVRGIAALMLFASVVTVMALVGYMLNYLKRVHPATWEALGQPALPSLPKTRPSMENVYAMLAFWGFVLLSNRYKALNDPQLAKVIWYTRILTALNLFLAPILK